MRWAIVLVVLVAVGGAAAFAESLPSSSWPMYQYRGNHNAVFGGPNWNVAWRADVGGKTNGGLSIVGDSLFIESFNRFIYALDARTGLLRWRRQLEHIAMNTPVVSNGIVIAGTGTSEHLSDLPQQPILGRVEGDWIYGLRIDTGRQLWRFKTVGEDMPTGVLAKAGKDDSFIFSNGDGHVYVLNARLGSLRRKQQIPGTSWMSSLAYGGSLAYGASADTSTRFYRWALATNPLLLRQSRSWSWAVRALDGQLVWIAPYGSGDCSPTLSDGKLFVEANYAGDSTGWVKENVVYGLNAGTGTMLWNYRAPPGGAAGRGSSESSIAGVYDRGVLYQSLPWIKRFAAFDARTGRVLWSLPVGDPVKMSAVVLRGNVYVGDTGGVLYVVRASDGSVLQRIRFPDIFTCAPPVIAGGTFFIANGSYLYALRLSDLNRGVLTWT